MVNHVHFLSDPKKGFSKNSFYKLKDNHRWLSRLSPLALAISSLLAIPAQVFAADDRIVESSGSTTTLNGNVLHSDAINDSAADGLVNVSGKNSVINADNVTISTTGKNINGLYAFNYGQANFNNGLITTTGQFAYAFRASSNSNITVSNSELNVSGLNTAGLFANGNSNIVANNLKITSSGSGIQNNGNSVITMTDGTITAAVGAQAINGNALVTVKNVDINASNYGANAMPGTNSIIIENGSIKSGNFGLYANGANTLINLSTGNTNITSTSHAAYALSGGHVLLNGDTLTTTGKVGHGLFAFNGNNDTMQSLITADGTTIATAGEGSYGAYSRYNGKIELLDSSIETSGQSAHGLAALGNHATINANNVNVTTEGMAAHTSWVQDGATLNFTNGSMHSAGLNAAALSIASSTTDISSANFNNVSIVSEQGTTISADKGNSQINLSNSRAIDNNGTWLNVANGGHTQVALDTSEVKGTALTAEDSTSTVTLSNTSLWTVTGDANVSSLINQNSTITFASPGSDITQQSSYRILKTHDYTGTGGVITLNTYLEGDDSPSDRLLIDGGHASGNTTLHIMGTGGQGALTVGDGIRVVDTANGATTDAGAFVLGNRVAAGAYEYQLYHGGRQDTGGDANDQNWYLRNTVIVNPPEVEQPEVTEPEITEPEGNVQELPNYRPEVPVSMVVPALANRLGVAMLGTYHDRQGEDLRYSEADTHAAWGRIFGETGDRGHKSGNMSERYQHFEQDGPTYDFDLYGFQTGFDLLNKQDKQGVRDMAGIYIGASRVDSNVDSVFGGHAGTVAMKGYSLGAYWTHKNAKDAYVDAVIQGTIYDDIDIRTRAGSRSKTDGSGFAASLEGGYPFALDNNWTIEPQAQAIYQHVSLDNFHDDYGQVQYGSTDTLDTRIGTRLTKTVMTQTEDKVMVWGRANLWHKMGADAKTTFRDLNGNNAVSLDTKLGSTWGQVGVGISGQLNKNWTVFATTDYNHALDGGKGSSVSGRIGVKMSW
ncbi:MULTISPECIES: autotransporter family protein [unclassified Serratia (in: enterobacteria)]|uniref:autotransporter family protein n=1 Tax=unclassified Serratia (in: enterobacteria) TaxID=2647522 RepID=UPI0030768470